MSQVDFSTKSPDELRRIKKTLTIGLGGSAVNIAIICAVLYFLTDIPSVAVWMGAVIIIADLIALVVLVKKFDAEIVKAEQRDLGIQ